MNQQTSLRRLLTFAKSFGINVAFGEENTFFTRTNRRRTHRTHVMVVQFSLFQFVHQRNTHSYVGGALAHELGHYLVAPKGRRHRKDYGIPLRQRTPEARDRWQLDDDKATMVEYQLMKHFSFVTKRLTPRVDPRAVIWWYETGKKMVSAELKRARVERAKQIATRDERRSKARTKRAVKRRTA